METRINPLDFGYITDLTHNIDNIEGITLILTIELPFNDNETLEIVRDALIEEINK